MKRFFCTVCNKVKRVQKWPHNVVNADSGVVTQRVGSCNHHFTGARGTTSTTTSKQVSR